MTIITFIFITAIACWACISIILYGIFHPKFPVNFLGIKIQGLLYARQTKICEMLSANIVQQALSKKDALVQSATSEENIEKLMPQIETHIQEFLTVKVPQQLPIIAAFLGEKTTHQIKEVFVKELRSLFPQVLAQYFSTVFDEKKLYKAVSAQITLSYETVMNTAFRENIRPIFFKLKLYALVIGFIIGGLAAFVFSLFT